MQLLICAHASLPYHPRCGSLMKEEEGEQAAMEPANERCVRRTKHAHAMEEKKSVSTLAQCKVCECS